jgi:hypothetical protein
MPREMSERESKLLSIIRAEFKDVPWLHLGERCGSTTYFDFGVYYDSRGLIESVVNWVKDTFNPSEIEWQTSYHVYTFHRDGREVSEWSEPYVSVHGVSTDLLNNLLA